LGIALIVFCIVALIHEGVTFLVPSTTDLDLFSITVSERHSIPLPPIVGGISLIAGIALVLNRRRRSCAGLPEGDLHPWTRSKRHGAIDVG